MVTLVTYRKFSDFQQAQELTELLDKNNIEYYLEEDAQAFDPSFTVNGIKKDYLVKINQQDFVKVDLLLAEITEKEVENVPPDYYLLEFTDEELMEVVLKRDEWSNFDYILARKLLKERGKEVSYEVLELINKQRINDLAKPEERQKAWIMAGYVLALLGGIISIFIGWHLLSFKKTLPNGQRIYSYASEDRNHGLIIMILGLLFFAGAIFLRFRIYF